MTFRNPTPQTDQNLRADYRLLEAVRCFCGDRKLMGESMCMMCWRRLEPGERTQLSAMRPGEGVAARAEIACDRIKRKSKAAW